jgi:hypothetical protein
MPCYYGAATKILTGGSGIYKNKERERERERE